MVSASPETTPEPLGDPGDKGGTVRRSARPKTTSVTGCAALPSKSFDLASSSNDDA